MSVNKNKISRAVKNQRLRSVRGVVRKMSEAEPATLRPIKQAIADAEAELLKALRGMNGKNLTDFQRHRIKQQLAQLKRGSASINRVEKTIEKSLLEAVPGIGRRAVSEASAQARALNEIFGRHSDPIDLSAAEITSTSARGIGTRIKNNAGSVSQTLGADVRKELTIAFAKSETFAEATARLEKRLPGRFVKAQHAAERIVRTEMMGAYNQVHADTIKALNEEDPGWVMRWDASADLRRCIVCKAFDGKIAESGNSFKAAPAGMATVRAVPPAHPNCRCVLTPWRLEWGDEKSDW